MDKLSVYRERYKFNGDTKAALYFVGDYADFEEQSQSHFMKVNGLQPDHKFLDLGCGCLRGTIKLVEYMDDGNFYGIDVSEGLIISARERLAERGIHKTVNLLTMRDFDLKSHFGKNKFDYILSVSLLTHIYPHDIPFLFAGVADVLKRGGTWFFTLYPTDVVPGYGTIECYFYSKEWLSNMASIHGLKIEDMGPERPNPCPNPNNIIKTTNSCLGQWVMKAVKE